MAEGHIIVPPVDVCALGEECVDEVEVALARKQVEGGPAILRWGSGEAAAKGGRHHR
jgi:hypothetical protein